MNENLDFLNDRICYGTGMVGKDWNNSILLPLKKSKYYIKTFFSGNKQLYRSIAVSKVVNTAMSNGICLFDTSRAYLGSELVLGDTLKRYERNSYYVITKVCNHDQINKTVEEGINKSLEKLNLEYVDILLLHWPVKDRFLESWKILENAYKRGLCKHIGVCNFNIHHLEELCNNAEIKPSINQIECHPLFTQEELREYCNKNNIRIMSYSSTARNDDRLNKTVLVDIARKYNKTITQIILRWHIQLGNVPIVNTYNTNHIKEDSNIYDFYLTENEIQQINNININSRLRYDPDNCDFSKL